ncbi:MAG: hypothetical protein ACI4RQ_03275, partial [Methanobrevibacter wolinii]
TLLVPYEKTLYSYVKLDDRYPLNQEENSEDNKIIVIKEHEKQCREKIKLFKSKINEISSEGKEKILILALNEKNYESHKVAVQMIDDRETLAKIAENEDEYPRIRRLARSKLEEIDNIVII